MKLDSLVSAYLTSPDAPECAVREYIARTRRAFGALPVRVAFTDQDPYGSAEHMRDAVRSSGVLAVWTGGSDGLRWAPLDNWRMRAVHDWTHHLRTTGGVSFSLDGERTAFRAAASDVPGLAPLLASEVLCQAAGYALRGEFLPQRVAWPDLGLLERGGAL